MLQFSRNFFSFLQACHFNGLSGLNTRRSIPFYGWTVTLLLLFVTQQMTSQVVYSASSRLSSIIGTSAFFRGEVNGNGIPIKSARIYALRVGQRLSQDKYWHHAYGNPEVGFGLEYLDIANDGEIGNPISTYMYVEAGLVDRKKIRITLTTDFGLSYGWKPYNTASNPNNVALGSRLNYHVGLGFRGSIYLSPNLAILVAPMLNHHSNGAVTKPNLGVNMVSLELGLKYWLQMRTWRKDKTATSRSMKAYSDISVFSGTRNVDIDGPYYQFYGLHANRVYGMTGRFMYGAGGEFIYDKASFADQQDVAVTDRISAAVYVMSAVHLDRLSLSLDIGRYIYRAAGDRIPTSQYYQRMSMRYRLTDKVFLAAKVRAFELRKADLLEFHVGYVL